MILSKKYPAPLYNIEEASWYGKIGFPIRSESLTIEHFSIQYEIESIGSRPFINVLNIDSGESTRFPMVFDSSESYWLEPRSGLPFSVITFDPYFSEGKTSDPILDFNYYLESAHRFRNFDLLTDTVSFSEAFMGEIYLKEHLEIIDRIGTPQLYWSSHIDSKNFEGQPGWILKLNGTDTFDEIDLGFVLETDREGLKRLLNLMKKPEQLWPNFALINPRKASILTARKALEDIRSKQSEDYLTLMDWKKRLEEANLGALETKEYKEFRLDPYYDEIDGAGTLSPIEIEIGNSILPIGLRLTIPKIPAMLLEIEPTLIGKPVAEINEWIKNNPGEVSGVQDKWSNNFNVLLPKLGYRQVKVPEYSEAEYWVTDLTVSEWNTIEAGIFEDQKDAEAHEFLDISILF